MEIKNLNLDMYRTRPASMERSDSLAHTRETGSSRANATSASVSRVDRVSVSREAVLRTEAFSTAMSVSSVRQEKIDRIRRQIASGEYQIDAHKIADRLVESERALFRR